MIKLKPLICVCISFIFLFVTKSIYAAAQSNLKELLQDQNHTAALEQKDNYQIKHIVVKPGKRLSLQYHRYRSEHWTVVKGEAKVFLDGNITILKEKKSIDIPKLSQHYISNETSEPLIIIEIQMGSYFGEDDIIRLDDPYQRN